MTGDVGCIVNGAGLSISTLDMIKLFGGSAANFFDIGGAAGNHEIEVAFRVVKANPKVKVIYVNIFGGILLTDRVADGIIAAVETVGIS
jgi:succinyl-CoA synthetase beta subunit